MHVYSADSDRGSKKVVFNALRPKMCMCPRNSGIDDSLIQSIKKKEKKRKERKPREQKVKQRQRKTSSAGKAAACSNKLGP